MTALRYRVLNTAGGPVAGRTAILRPYTGNRYRDQELDTIPGISATSTADGWLNWDVTIQRVNRSKVYYQISGLGSEPIVVGVNPNPPAVVNLGSYTVGSVNTEGDLTAFRTADPELDARYAPLDPVSRRVPVRHESNGVRVGTWFPGYTNYVGGTSATMTQDHVAQLEADLGTGMDYVLIFQGLAPDQPYRQSDWDQVQGWLDSGREVVLNLETGGSHANINNGRYDAAIDQFGAFLRGYAETHPNWRDTLAVKVLHEGNLTPGYAWCVYTTANLSAAGGSVTASAANYVTAFRRIADRYRAATTLANGRRLARLVWEVGNSNANAAPEPFDIFYPGDAFVDIVSINNYNRYGISSGSNHWGRFGDIIGPALDAVRRIAPSKPVMIGESSSTSGGYVGSIQVTAGGTGYAAGTTATITDPAGRGTGAAATVTVAGGVITGLTITNRGQDYNFISPPTVTLSNAGGGTGATFNPLVYGSKYSKAEWYRDACLFVRDQSDITHLTFFLQNIAVTPDDNRNWAPNTPEERAALADGIGQMRGRVKNIDLARQKLGTNLCADPHTNDSTKWTTAGPNAGTLTFTASPDNLPGVSDARNQVSSGAVSGNVVRAARLTHNGTAGAPDTNRVRIAIPGKMINSNEPITVSFDARAKRLSGSGEMYVIPALESVNPFYLPTRIAGIKLTSQYRRYKVTISSGDPNGATNGWLLAFAIGSSSMNGEFQWTNVKVEYGGEATPMLPSMRQLNRTTVANSDYNHTTAAGVSGSTDTLIAYTSLTAARTVTLPDARLVPPGTEKIVKDEVGTAATSNITVAAPTGNTIDGAASKVINTAYGALRLYSNGANWFTL